MRTMPAPINEPDLLVLAFENCDRGNDEPPVTYASGFSNRCLGVDHASTQTRFDPICYNGLDLHGDHSFSRIVRTNGSQKTKKWALSADEVEHCITLQIKDRKPVARAFALALSKIRFDRKHGGAAPGPT